MVSFDITLSMLTIHFHYKQFYDPSPGSSMLLTANLGTEMILESIKLRAYHSTFDNLT